MLVYLRGGMDWGLEKSLLAITTDNASELINGVGKLNEKIHDELRETDSILRFNKFHVRCVGHIVNLAVKDCMSLFQEEIRDIRSVLNSRRSSVKRHDAFEAVRNKRGIKQELPFMEVDTRWSSIFIMIKEMYAFRRVINGTIHRIVEMLDTLISERTWVVSYKVSSFLESAALVTETQSGLLYATLSRTSKLLHMLEKKCESALLFNDAVVSKVASVMGKKLQQYRAMTDSTLGKLAKALDPRFSSDIIRDGDILRKLVDVPTSPCLTIESSKNNCKNIPDELENEESVTGLYEDDIT